MSVIPFDPERRHARASAPEGIGRGTSAGHSAEGQFSENQSIARSRRRTCMSAPPSIALSFLPSSSARELTVESGTPSMPAYARAMVSNCSMPVMGQISVNLPDKSTVNLPDAQYLDFGHSTGMGTPEKMLARIDERKAVMGLKDDAIGRRAGHPDCVRNLRRSVERGSSRGLSDPIVTAIAAVLGCAPAWLRAEPGAPQPAVPHASLKAKLIEQAKLEDQQRRIRDKLLAVTEEIEALRRADKQEAEPRRRKIR